MCIRDRYTVHHLGGDSSFAVNQTMGGGTWIYLGRFLLDAGSQEVVTLTNRSRQAGRIVSADAVKIGGGYGNIARTVCDSLRRPGMVCHLETSGYPRFCEGARYWLQWAGFDEKVYSPKENRDDYKDDYMSVSYTHLDVYKRQGLPFGRSRFVRSPFWFPDSRAMDRQTR